MTTTVHALATSTVEVAGARIYHEVRGTGPALVLVGSPMDATSFAPAAELLATEHTVVTLDPRGIHRSPVEDRDADSMPEMRADDVATLLRHLDLGPAAVFGSSGGAVTALALAQAHPDLVHTVVAHEPPLDELLEDAEDRKAVTEEIIHAYVTAGRAAAWTLFLADANIELPPPVFEAMFGAPLDGHEAADEDYFFQHELRPTTRWVPDLDALTSKDVRLVVGIGAESTGQVCDRTSTALAAALGVEPTIFPGDHTGFVDDPEAFARFLRTVLAPA